MKWEQVLAVFNFITWLAPIAIRSWIAWRFKDVGRNNVSPQELGELGKSIERIDLGSEELKIIRGEKQPGRVEGSNE